MVISSKHKVYRQCCDEMSLVLQFLKIKFWPYVGIKWRVIASTKLLQIILRGTSMCAKFCGKTADLLVALTGNVFASPKSLDNGPKFIAIHLLIVWIWSNCSVWFFFYFSLPSTLLHVSVTPQCGTTKRRSVQSKLLTGPRAPAAVGWGCLLVSPTTTHGASWRERPESVLYDHATASMPPPRWKRLNLTKVKEIKTGIEQRSNIHNFLSQQLNFYTVKPKCLVITLINKNLFHHLSISALLPGKKKHASLLSSIKSNGWNIKSVMQRIKN